MKCWFSLSMLVLWISPFVHNLSLDHVLTIALCMARCSNEQCRQGCDTMANKSSHIPFIDEVTKADIDLQCRDVDRLVLKHNVGIYVIEKREFGKSVWSSPVISREKFYQFSKLKPASRHRYRVRRVTAEGVALPETSDWYETNKENYVPAMAKNASVGRFSVDAKIPGRLQTWLNIVPADDLNCLYDVVHWASGHDLHQYQLNAIRQFGLKLNYVEYDSSNAVYVISRNDVDSRRSKNLTLKFEAPSCLDFHGDLNVCAPAPVTGLGVLCTQSTTTTNGVDFRIAWDEPKLRPDNYTVVVEPLDGGETSYEVVVFGNQTTANVDQVAKSYRYRVGVIAESVGGASAVQWKLFTRTDRSTTGSELILLVSTMTSLLVLLAVAYTYYRSRIEITPSICKYSVFENVNNRKGAFDGVIGPPRSRPPSTLDVKEVAIADEFDISLDHLTMKKALGSGISGIVKLATLHDGRKKPINVAVKMLREDATESDLKNFQREILLMKSTGRHKNIVSLIGCCTPLGRNPLLVVEYCSKGDLQSYLRKILEEATMEIVRNARRPRTAFVDCSFSNYINGNVSRNNETRAINNYLYDIQQEVINEHKLSPEDLLNIARQVATGMEFLSSNRIVHRDLAARNVLVCSDKTVKISDFGLSRDIYQDNVYKKQSNDKLPLKWMAIEALTHQVYTTYSDVWSFGILLYEIVTLGGNPYPEWDSSEILHLIKSGYRMERPPNCGFQLYSIMRSCWCENPLNRPTFSQLLRQLDMLISNISKNEYLNLPAVDRTNDNRR